MIYVSIIPLLLMAAAVWFFVWVLSSLVTRFSGWNRVYEMIGKRYGAIVRPGGFIRKPMLGFHYGNTFCKLQNLKNRAYPTGRLTQLSLNWPDTEMRLEITSSRLSVNDEEVESEQKHRRIRLPRIRSKQPVEPIVISDAPFASNLSIKSNHAERAKIVLSSGVQWQLEQLRRHMGDGQLHVSLRKGKLCISKPNWIKHHQLLDDFVRFSLELYDQMVLTNCKGIEFVNDHRLSVVDDVTCPICSERVYEHMVVCVRCKTPHCLDCWQYNGQCATFACNETRYVRASASATTKES